MSRGITAGVAATAAAMLLGGEAHAQAADPRGDTRAALTAQVWGEGSGVMLQPPPQGGVRLLYQTSSSQAALAYLPSDGAVRTLAPEPRPPGAPRKRAKLGYALTDRVELFVDLQKRQTGQAGQTLAQDWLPETVRRPRTYAVGLTTRW